MTVDANIPIMRDDERFPRSLLPIVPEVKALYYRGTWDGAYFTKCVAVVGSRKMSPYGKHIVAHLAPRLAAAGCTLVSGFMHGIDIEIHRRVQFEGGRVVGVLGHGISYDNDVQNDNLLYKSIDNNTLFISEWEQCVPKPHTYLLRNRIVVGLSDTVIIVEAGDKSGSLHSADWAKKLGKKLFAVPGSIQSPVSRGTNDLIARGDAELMTWKALDAYLGCSPRTESPVAGTTSRPLAEVERSLVTLLRNQGPLSTHEIVRAASYPTSDLIGYLTSLELDGVISQERGEWKIL